MKTILDILHDIRPEFDFSKSDDFIRDGMLDSFDVMVLISELEKAYGKTIPGTDIVPENFRNIDVIRDVLRKSGATL